MTRDSKNVMTQEPGPKHAAAEHVGENTDSGRTTTCGRGSAFVLRRAALFYSDYSHYSGRFQLMPQSAVRDGEKWGDYVSSVTALVEYRGRHWAVFSHTLCMVYKRHQNFAHMDVS